MNQKLHWLVSPLKEQGWIVGATWNIKEPEENFVTSRFVSPKEILGGRGCAVTCLLINNYRSMSAFEPHNDFTIMTNHSSIGILPHFDRIVPWGLEFYCRHVIRVSEAQLSLEHTENSIPNSDQFHSLKTPWSESASELYRLSGRRLSAKYQLLADRGCHVVSVTDPYGRILGFLDRSRYFSIK
jgi:hypothetical protein